MTASNATGVLRVWGKDQRSAVTGADVSPITVATMSTGPKAVRLTLHLNLTAYASGTVTYTVTWTENGHSKSLSVAASALNSPQTTTGMPWPDDSTTVTVQVTGTFAATAAVETTVEVLQEADFLLYVNDPNGLTQAAIDDAVSSGYTGIYLDANVTYAVTSTLTLGASGGTNQPFILRSTMYGGSRYGSRDVPPAHYISISGVTDGIHVPDGATKVRLEGVAVIGTASGACVHLNGAQESGLDSCYVKNTTNGSGYAVVVDASSGGGRPEGNTSSRCFFKGWRALGIGVSDVTYKPGNSLWNAITTDGVESGVYLADGGNNVFLNWYDRSGPSVAAFNQVGGVAIVIGGEDYNSAVANDIALSGGQLWIERRAITGGGGTVDVSVTGGDLYLYGVRSNSYNVTQSNGTVTIGRDTYSASATFTCNGGTMFYPTKSAHGKTPGGSGTITAY